MIGGDGYLSSRGILAEGGVDWREVLYTIIIYVGRLGKGIVGNSAFAANYLKNPFIGLGGS